MTRLAIRAIGRAGARGPLLCLMLAAGCGRSEPPAPVAAAPTGATAASLPTRANPMQPPGPAPAGMVWIPGGEFSMGTDAGADSLCALPGLTRDARPIHRVYVDGFWMDATEVTNAQFAAFVAATKYVTVAERTPTAEEVPGAPPEALVAGSAVFTPTAQAVPLDNPLRWWRYQRGANWRQPEGPGSTIAGRERYPVVHVAWEDAVAYADWAGNTLPTEAEWEFAARGGLSGQLYAWGSDFHPDGHAAANTHQGPFPVRDTAADGFAGLAPVARYAPNGYGLYDVAGNAWEWVADWYRADAYERQAVTGGVARNPRGPDESWDPEAPGEPRRVQRGGSFLCTDQYCSRFIVGSRGKGEPKTSSNHVGFRTVRR